MISSTGFKIVINLWLNHYRAIRYKPREASLWSSLNPFSSQVFWDTIRKTLKYLDLHFYRLGHQTSSYCYAQLPFESGFLIFDWDDRAQVLSMIKETYHDKIYGQPPQGLVVDVGANLGIYSLYASARARVIAIEPFRKNWEFLRLNSNKNVAPFQLAIGSTDGQRKLFLSDLTASCSFDQKGLSSSYVIVETKRLDTFLRELGIEKVDALKIDTEGAEIEVLKSGGDYLSERKIKQVAVAAYHYSTEAQEVHDLLSSCGYTVLVNRSSEVIVFGLALAS